MSWLRPRPFAAPISLVLLIGLFGCTQYPRFLRGRPTVVSDVAAPAAPEDVDAYASSQAPLQWGFTGLRFEVAWEYDVSGFRGERTLHESETESLCHFSVDLAGVLPEEPPNRRRGRPAGDVRSDDVSVTVDDYRMLVEAWTVEGECGVPEGGAGPSPVARMATEGYVDEALEGLRRESARLGADAIHDVQCFAMHDRFRLWCEGRAYSTDS